MAYNKYAFEKGRRKDMRGSVDPYLNYKPKDCSNLVMAFGMTIAASKLREFQKQGRMTRTWHTNGVAVDIIHSPELLEELLNYSPNKNKMNFYKSFAVTGDIIELLTFEKELLKLGYKSYETVFNYRGYGMKTVPFSAIPIDPATHITIGVHVNSRGEGRFTPAVNDGGSCIVYDLSNPSQNANAYKSAKENAEIFNPTAILTTEDGIKKFTDNHVYYVNKNFVLGEWKKLKEEYLENAKTYKFFHSRFEAIEYVKQNKPLYSVKEVDSMLRTVKKWPADWTLVPPYPEGFVNEL